MFRSEAGLARFAGGARFLEAGTGPEVRAVGGLGAGETGVCSVEAVVGVRGRGCGPVEPALSDLAETAGSW